MRSSGEVPPSEKSARAWSATDGLLAGQRTVNPLIVPARYNFLYSSLRPALRPGSHTTDIGEPASPSQPNHSRF
jgi:hypothetical protein